MKYKLPDYENPTLVEIAEENDVEILGTMEYDKDSAIHYVAKHINEILFDLVWVAKPQYTLNDLQRWVIIMSKMTEEKTVHYDNCFGNSIFYRNHCYFGGMQFNGTDWDMRIISEREAFVDIMRIDAFCRVKKISDPRFNHFESYKTRKGEIVCVVSNYTQDVPPYPFLIHEPMYHKDAKTYVALFDSKMEYNKWRKEVINEVD